MSQSLKKSASVCQLPKLQTISSIKAARFIQNYLLQMRTLEMPDYSKIKSSIKKESLSQIFPKNAFKKPMRLEKELIVVTVQRYLQVIDHVFTQKNSQHFRRLVRKIQEMIQNYPLMSECLFQSLESRRLVTNPEVLLSRLSDDHNPPLVQIIDKIEQFDRQQQEAELNALGSRIQSLSRSLTKALEKPVPDNQTRHILKIHRHNRPDQTICKSLAISQVKYGQFSKSFRKKQELFVKLTKVVDTISDSYQRD